MEKPEVFNSMPYQYKCDGTGPVVFDECSSTTEIRLNNTVCVHALLTAPDMLNVDPMPTGKDPMESVINVNNN